MPVQLALRGVSKSYADHLVLDDVSLTVRPGERLCVVGDNGSGKSTLLRLLAGAEPPDDGTVTVSDGGGGTGHLGQTIDLPGHLPVQRTIDAALAELRTIETRLRRSATLLEDSAASEDPAATAAPLLSEYGALLHVFEERGGYEADARTERSLHALGLGGLDRDRPLHSLSGGNRARLGLACLLASAPRLMLLDEPTNHLAPALVEELETALESFGGAVVVVSHDRALSGRFRGERLRL